MSFMAPYLQTSRPVAAAGAGLPPHTDHKLCTAQEALLDGHRLKCMEIWKKKGKYFTFKDIIKT